jgi:hypothetical protein
MMDKRQETVKEAFERLGVSEATKEEKFLRREDAKTRRFLNKSHDNSGSRKGGNDE